MLLALGLGSQVNRKYFILLIIIWYFNV
jgi:hypothetical protein